MKKITIRMALLLLSMLPFATVAAEPNEAMGHMMHHQMHGVADQRISLGLSPEMKRHQLANMRSHVEAVRSIVGMLAEGQYDAAAEVAHTRLGLTDEMKQMCDRFTNADFRKLGLAFHKSGDALGDILKTRDPGKSLHALHETMGYCVECHSRFRQ